MCDLSIGKQRLPPVKQLNNGTFVLFDLSLKLRACLWAIDLLDKRNLAGLSDRGVELYLTSFDEIESAEVVLSPFWVKKVPSLPDHITIEIID